MKNVGGHFETWNTGILGPVVLYGLRHGKWDLSSQKWTYQVPINFISWVHIGSEETFLNPFTATLQQVGLKGEAMDLISPSGFSPVEWMQASMAAQTPQPLTWHKVTI